jgi:2-methylaconitate cis-trans-isomerase PrpF
MRHRRLRAVFMRGGTSKAVMFRAEDLPGDRAAWDAIFLGIMGSPDPNGRQLDGMGGGVSSLSKVCVIGPPSRSDADVDYTFAQVAIKDAAVDYGGNCGNMSGAVGPFAVEEGLVAAPRDGEAVVRIHNTNTGKIIVSRFPVADGALAAEGELEIDGVEGRSAPVRLEFLEPGGAKTGRLLPTGNARDQLEVEGLGRIAATLVDAANPAVFVAAADLGKTGSELPDALEADREFLARMEAIRRAGSVAMGLAADLEAAGRQRSVPLVAMVAAPAEAPTLSGRALAPDETDIQVRMISVGQPHKATPITGAVCLAIAAQVPGGLPHAARRPGSGPLRIGHPSGVTLVDAEVSGEGAALKAEHGAVYRTARRLFEGNVLWRG